MRRIRLLTAGLLVLGVTACADKLDVPNTNAPDGERALNRPSDVEGLIGSSYQAVHSAIYGSSDAIETQTIVMSMESFSNLANFGFNLRSAIPRGGIDNSRNNAVLTGNYRDFLNLHRAARQAAVGLGKVNDPNFTFYPSNAAQKARAQAMAHFTIGAALGNVALIYDQGTIVGPNDPPSNTNPPPLPLVRYDTLMTYALQELDSAIAKAGVANGLQASIFPTPTGWFGASGSAGLTYAQFVGLIHAYKARFMAGVARTPADRAAVNWATVITEATAGAAAFTPNDVNLQMNTTLGWSLAWISQSFASNSTNWHMATMFMLGMADTSGAYDAWLAAKNATKVPFLVITPDRRFPQGATRAAQQATGGNSGTQVLTAPQYYRNRSVADWAGDPWANSWYDHFRFRPYFNTASGAVPHPVFPLAEMNMLAAEGYIRTNAFDQAAALINITRVGRGNLPTLPNGMTATTPVPGSAAGCVPRIPQPPNFTSAACGNMMEAMKWEKRLETQFANPYSWYLDARGWGDLPQGTALYWPVPYQEIDTRQLMANPPSYTNSVGGVGNPGGAAVSTYGPISTP